jgi:hypothetical protein
MLSKLKSWPRIDSTLASSAGISLEYFNTHSQAKTHRDACGGGYTRPIVYWNSQMNQIHIYIKPGF